MSTPSLRGRWLLAIPCLCAPALAQLDPNGAGVTRPSASKKPLSDCDVRLTRDGQPAEWVNERNAELSSQNARAAREADKRALLSSIPLLRVDDDALFGTPRWVASTARFLTAAAPGDDFDGVAVARGFVAAHPGLFEIAPEEIDFARRSRDFHTRHNGVRHLTFQQQIGGVDLFGAELRANVTRHGELINVSSTMLPRPSEDFAPGPIVLSPLHAIRTAAACIGVAVTVDPERLGAPRGASRLQAWGATPDFRSDVAVTTELLYFPMTRDEIRPAWKVVLPEIGVGNTYEVLVDAADGKRLWSRNRLQFLLGGTQDITMRVYTRDSPAPGSPGNATPNGFQFPFDTRQLLTITPASVPQSPNNWINDNDNDTQGNNVDAHLDLDNDNLPDLPRPTGSPARTFDFAQDNAQSPTLWRDAAVTNLFYFCNRYHDKLYSLGFDEAAGNFQTDNFGLGGLGNDRVLADAQDGGGTNNANFGTGPDGTSGRMQMYVFTGPNPDRDGDVDSDIVYHEHSHGLSNRLHNLQVSGVQAGGMGEGWSDFFGVMINAEPSDDPSLTYHTGGYTVYLLGAGFVDNYYFGIRRFPYSTDLNKNPTTYADIDPAQQSFPPGIPRSPVIGNSANEVHNVGEVWCNMLLEVRANLWASHGFAGNDLLMQLVVDGMKNDPGTPNFLQARDGILLADMVNNGSANLADIWTGFAKRGCGYSATSPSGSTSAGVVEAFDTPVIFDYPSGRPTQLSPGQAATFQVNISGIGSLQPIPGTGQLHLSINGGAFTATAMTETSANHYDATLPAGACFDALRFYVSTATTSGTAVNPAGAPATFFSASVFTGTQVVFNDNFETDQGWATSVSGATTGAWERGVPVNDPGWAYDPVSDADGSGQCYLTMNQLGNTDVDNGSVTLTSPNFDMTGGADVGYSYYLNLTDETGGVDRLLVEINSAGGAGGWTTIATHTTGGGTTWQTNTVTSATLTGLGVSFTSTMKVRFTANDANPQSVVEAGVDAVRVQKILCTTSGGFTSFCDPGASGVMACPCSNVPSGSGRGCNNFGAMSGGASLSATGTGSLAADTLVFTSTGENNSSLTIFLQGTASTATGLQYGAGVRCVDGTLKRLYTGGASAGAITRPGGGDPNVHTRSAALGDPISAGQSRYYMTYYRDPLAAGPCGNTASTFNDSQAGAVVWAP